MLRTPYALSADHGRPFAGRRDFVLRRRQGGARRAIVSRTRCSRPTSATGPNRKNRRSPRRARKPEARIRAAALGAVASTAAGRLQAALQHLARLSSARRRFCFLCRASRPLIDAAHVRPPARPTCRTACCRHRCRHGGARPVPSNCWPPACIPRVFERARCSGRALRHARDRSRRFRSWRPGFSRRAGRVLRTTRLLDRKWHGDGLARARRRSRCHRRRRRGSPALVSSGCLRCRPWPMTSRAASIWSSMRMCGGWCAMRKGNGSSKCAACTAISSMVRSKTAHRRRRGEPGPCPCSPKCPRCRPRPARST